MKANNEILRNGEVSSLEPEPEAAAPVQPEYAICMSESETCLACSGRGYFLGVTGYGSMVEGKAACIQCGGTGTKSEIRKNPESSAHTFTRWAIRHKPSGNFLPESLGKYTQAEPIPNCIPRLFDTRQGAVSSLNRWLEGIWRLSYYRCGEYNSEWDYDWGPEPPPTPRVKSEMEVVEVEIQIRMVVP